MNENNNEHKQTLFVYGSCVGRDVSRIHPNELKTVKYIARQSWISATSNPILPPSAPSKLTSEFQKRMVLEDYASSFPDALRTNKTQYDTLLLDLIDERLGVIESTDGIITNSYEFRNSGWKKHFPDSKVLEFGTQEHFELWKIAAERLLNMLTKTNTLHRTALIRAHYATHADNGYDLSQKMRKSPDTWNELFRRYYDHAESIGIPTIAVEPEVCVASSSHEWGMEAFHYTDRFYQIVARKIADLRDTNV